MPTVNHGLPEESKVGVAHHEDDAADKSKSSAHVDSTEKDLGFEVDTHNVEYGYYSSTRFWGSMVAIGLSMGQTSESVIDRR